MMVEQHHCHYFLVLWTLHYVDILKLEEYQYYGHIIMVENCLPPVQHIIMTPIQFMPF